MSEALERRVRRLEQRLARMAAGLERDIVWSTDNVTNPPTNAEVDTAFGTASDLYDGFVGVIDDAGAGATYWLLICDATHDTWLREQLVIV